MTTKQTQANLSQYKSQYPDANFKLISQTNIFTILLQYFRKDNIQILMNDIDIFNQGEQEVGKEDQGQSGNDNKQLLTFHYRQYLKTRGVDNKYDQESEEQDPRDEQKQNKQADYGTAVDFVQYLVSNLGASFCIKWRNDEEQVHQQQCNQFNDNVEKTIEKEDLAQYRFTEEETKFLFTYYKHFCESKVHYPKGKTFDDLKSLYETMTLPQWMMFCKKIGLTAKNTDFSHNKRHIATRSEFQIVKLQRIFQKREQFNKKMLFKDFCAAVSDIIDAIHNNNQAQQFQTPEIDPYIFLGLKNQSNHHEVLDKIGIRYIRQKIYFTNLGLSSSTSPNNYLSRSVLIKRPQQSHTPIKKHIPLKPRVLKKQSQHVTPLKQIHNNTKKDKQQEKPKVKHIKFYRNRQQRKQSQLMKKLNIGNLSEVHATKDVLSNIEKLGVLKNDDQYLKEYNRREKSIRNGVINRIDERIKKMKSKGK